jgi:hypothetical protein
VGPRGEHGLFSATAYHSKKTTEEMLSLCTNPHYSHASGIVLLQLRNSSDNLLGELFKQISSPAELK